MERCGSRAQEFGTSLAFARGCGFPSWFVIFLDVWNGVILGDPGSAFRTADGGGPE